jgi:periplasmic protein TonB
VVWTVVALECIAHKEAMARGIDEEWEQWREMRCLLEDSGCDWDARRALKGAPAATCAGRPMAPCALGGPLWQKREAGMFEDATFESMGRIHTQSRSWMLATLALNGGMLAALVLFPLLHPEALQRAKDWMPLTIPEQRMPAPVRVRETNASAPTPTAIDRALQPPRLVPSRIDMSRDTAPPATGTMVQLGDETTGPGDANGVFQRGGEMPVVRSAPRGAMRVSSSLVEGLLVRKTLPVYPPIARTMHMQGTVVLQATISTTGTIEHLHVVSGPAMLQQAALDAVKRWVYRPYILNGKPVEVETTVQVEFRLD